MGRLLVLAQSPRPTRGPVTGAGRAADPGRGVAHPPGGYFLSLGTFSGGGSIATPSFAPGIVGILPGLGNADSGMSFRSFLRSFSASSEYRLSPLEPISYRPQYTWLLGL